MKAIFGLGCFWNPEARYASLEQVKKTKVGYAGGTKQNPSYRRLGDHTEVIQLEYENEYEKLLSKFWKWHKPNRKMKKQYRSLILVLNEEQKQLAEKTKPKNAVTKIKYLDKFHLAETYHQKYHLRNSEYFKKFNQLSEEEFLNSEKAARYNAVAANYLTESKARKILE